MSKKLQLPYVFQGGLSTDERGEVGFVNDFSFPEVKRFYTVKNHKKYMVRAWHGHKKEAKFVYALTGKALLGAIAVDNWENPSKKAKVHKFRLDAKKPSIVYIPPGYVNGFQSLTANAKLMFFSTSTLKDSLGDDIRFDKEYWNIWTLRQAQGKKNK